MLELGIFVLYLVLNPRAARRRKEEQDVGAGSIAAETQDIEQATDAPVTRGTTPEWSRHTTFDEKSAVLTPEQQNVQHPPNELTQATH